uniref:Uncharacterized protein n=1 Tax=Spongospora subterranea TaxID=70186 RepID=A0A0H5QSM0_9EUKA|eukprot:CRZ04576.1 hypothetical protein [Spongospora subterranea]
MVVVRALKFLLFRKKFDRLTLNASPAARLDAAYKCLLGNAQDKAVNEPLCSCDELMDKMARWYASDADPTILVDVFRNKLQNTRPYPQENLEDYLDRYLIYWNNLCCFQEASLFTESSCCLWFLRTIRCKPLLYAEVMRRNGRKMRTLSEVFAVVRDSCQVLMDIEAVSNHFTADRSTPSQNTIFNNHRSPRPESKSMPPPKTLPHSGISHRPFLSRNQLLLPTRMLAEYRLMIFPTT